TLSAPLADERTERLGALAAALAIDAANREAAPVLRSVPSGWRNVVSQPQWLDLDGPSSDHHVTYRIGRDGLVAQGYDGVALLDASPAAVVLDDSGVRHRFAIARYGNDFYVDNAAGAVHFVVVERFADPADHVAPGSLLAPMPGSVVRVAVASGDAVAAGQPILWLEAMKMQHQVNAPVDGVVAELPVTEGQQVDVGVVLAVVSPTEGDSE